MNTYRVHVPRPGKDDAIVTCEAETALAAARGAGIAFDVPFETVRVEKN
jgi:hypothetical protein